MKALTVAICMCAAVIARGDDTSPRVLIIGDSISNGYMAPLQTLLADSATLTHNPGIARHTGWGRAHLDDWLGDTSWDVIHFNFGLHDLKYVDAAGKNTTSKEGAHIQVPLEEYRENLEAIVKRLQQTGAALIFATTTSFPAELKATVRDPEDVARYNAAAVDVMKEHGVTVNDLGAWSKSRLPEIQRPNDVHFSEEGYKVLAEKVAESIRAALHNRAGRTP